MKNAMAMLSAALLAISLAGGSTALAQPAPVAELAQPSPEATPHPAYLQALARNAYVWGWPMVNMQNRHDRITQAPHPGLLGGMLPAA